MNLIDLITYINTRHSTSFAIERRLPGGLQDGAYVLMDAGGRRAVLKQMYALRALPIMRRLSASGYPTPAPLYAGEATDGTPYLLQEYVPGEPIHMLTEDYLNQILALNDQQANFNPSASAYFDESWSRYVHDMVFANESNWAPRLRAYSPQTAGLLAAIEKIARPHAGVAMPDPDLVHGDFHTGNILALEGRITGVIDMTYAGYGLRVIDLATLLHRQYAANGLPSLRDRLLARTIEIAGAAVGTICLCYQSLAMVEWSIRNERPDEVERSVLAGWAILEDLAQLQP